MSPSSAPGRSPILSSAFASAVRSEKLRYHLRYEYHLAKSENRRVLSWEVLEARFCQRMNLGPGSYTVTVAIASHDAKEFYDWQEAILSFEVEASSTMQGIVNLHSEIDIASLPLPGCPKRDFHGPFAL